MVYKSHSYENKKIVYTLHRFSPPCRLASALYIGCGRRRLCSLYRLWPPSPQLTISVVAAVASAHYIGCGRLSSLYRLWPPQLTISVVAASAHYIGCGRRRLCSLYRLWPPRPHSPVLIVSVVAAAAAFACTHCIGCGRLGRLRLYLLQRWANTLT